MPMPKALGVDTTLQQSDDYIGVTGIDSDPLGGGGLEPWEAPQAANDAARDDSAKAAATTEASPAFSFPSDGNATRNQVVQFGSQFLGMMYKWGGNNPKTSFDCSGLVQYVLGQFGVKMPRISYQQANFGRRVGLDQLRPGDLVAWDNSSRNNGADHIAIYIGNGQILEAAKSGTPIRIRKLGEDEGAWGVAITYPGEGKGTNRAV